MKHGLLAEGVTELDGPENFTNFCAKLEAELKPEGELERFLVRRIAFGAVRLKRVGLLEAEFITAQLNPRISETKTIPCEMSALLAEMNDVTETVILDPGLPARLSVDAVDALANTFARYETAIENRMLRALNQLERMQSLRRGEKVPLPTSMDVALHAEAGPVASFGNPPGVGA